MVFAILDTPCEGNSSFKNLMKESKHSLLAHGDELGELSSTGPPEVIKTFHRKTGPKVMKTLVWGLFLLNLLNISNPSNH